MMLKGVNKHIVEINNPNNEYFEKAILFVKSEKLFLPPETLSNHAFDYLNTLGKPKKRDFKKIFITALLFLGIVALITGIILFL